MSIIVSNSAQLTAALNTAKPGQTILLRGGDYGNFEYGNKAFSTAVELKSEDRHNPAVFTSFEMSEVRNVSIEGVKFDFQPAFGAPTWQSPFKLRNVENVTIKKSVFDGAPASGLGPEYDRFGIGIGLSVAESDHVTIRGNEFFNFCRGATFGSTTHLKILNNDVHNMSSDGLDFANVDNVVIKGNSLHDFKRPPHSTAHPDMIQFWTTGTSSPSTNIKILDNFLYRGDGITTQSIFMRNELVDSGQAGNEMFYRDILIAGNVIKNGQYHGITVGETSGLVIRKNTIVQAETAEASGTVSIPSVNIAAASRDVSVHHNILPRLGDTLTASSARWHVDDNYIVQTDNWRAANYAGYVFVDGLDVNPEWSDFALISHDAGKMEGAGAIRRISNGGPHDAGPSSGAHLGYIAAAQPDADAHLVELLQLGKILRGGKTIDTSGAIVSWDFGDGTDGNGLAVGHVYKKPGEYVVTATVVLAGGKTFELERTIEIRSGNYLDLDFEKNMRDRSPVENALKESTGATLVSRGQSQALSLKGGPVSYESNSDFVFNPEFTLAADFKKLHGTEEQGGWLLYKSGSFTVGIGADRITANLTTSKGSVTLEGSNLAIENSAWHRVAVTFSASAGVAKLMLDGHVIDITKGVSEAVLLGSTGSDFVLGSLFGSSFKGRVDNVSYIDEALSRKDIASHDIVASWLSGSEKNNPIVEAHSHGHDSVDLSEFMTERAIGNAFFNSHYGLLSDSGFDLI